MSLWGRLAAATLESSPAYPLRCRCPLGRERSFGKSNQHRAKSTHFIIEVRDADLLNGKFKATYYKPAGRPNLILGEGIKTDDESLPAEAFQVAKARELGWIV